MNFFHPIPAIRYSPVKLKKFEQELSLLSGLHKKLPLLFLLCWFVFSKSTAQEAPRKKIGLVLSGGGAKGLAHIGALKVIDSLGIQIDYIGGTSMGAIVGGLYASGYSGKQLDSIFSKVDIEALVQDNMPRSSKILMTKRNDDIYAVTLPFKKFKLETPSGFSKGIYNFNFLSQLTYHARSTRDFKKLPIPFFCMATDLETGESILLEKGILPQALIASGCIPSLYYPIEIDGRMLIDGGVTNNYPVEELKQKGVDIIIGIDVQEELKTRKEITSITSVLGQINNYNTQKIMPLKKQKTDIYIRPNIQGFNVLSFEDGKKIIKNGEMAALENLEQLSLLSNNYFREKIKVATDSLFVGNIDFTRLKNQSRSYVLGKLKIKQNEKTSFKKFHEGIFNLNATQNFSSVKYQFNEKDVFLNLRENKINTFLKFSLHYDGLYKSAALVNFTQNKLFYKNDLMSIDFIFGDNLRYDFNYLIDNGYYWSFGINSSYQTFNKTTKDAFGIQPIINSSGFQKINLNLENFVNKFFVQTVFLRKFNIGSGIEFNELMLSSPNLPEEDETIEDSAYTSFFGFLNYDTFDNKFFPNKGFYIKGMFNHYFYSSSDKNPFSPFSITKGEIGWAFSPKKRWSISLINEGGFKVGRSSSPFFDFSLGGYGFRETNNIRPFLGHDFLSLNGNSYIKGTLNVDFECFKKNHINFTYNAAIVDEFIFTSTKTWLTKPTYNGFAFGYGLETFLGPVEVKYVWNSENNFNAFWFNVGFTF